MHIHGNPMISNGASLHSAAAAEKAASTQRAAETRKRLLRGGIGLDGELNPEAVVMVGRWTDGGSQDRRHERGAPSDTPHDVDAASTATPVSVWA